MYGTVLNASLNRINWLIILLGEGQSEATHAVDEVYQAASFMVKPSRYFY